ncbi:hypothetical protein D3C84_1066170 [compost metagenome]
MPDLHCYHRPFQGVVQSMNNRILHKRLNDQRRHGERLYAGIYDKLVFQPLFIAELLNLQITADHIQLLLQCNLAAPNLKAASHHLAEEADNSGNFLLVLHMGFHTNRL